MSIVKYDHFFILSQPKILKAIKCNKFIITKLAKQQLNMWTIFIRVVIFNVKIRRALNRIEMQYAL